MEDIRLKQIHESLAFLMCVIKSGEPLTKRVYNEFSKAVNTLEALDGLLAQEKELVCGSKCDYGHRDEKGNDFYCCIKKTK